MQMRVALVVRVDGDCRVAKHSLQTRRRDNDFFLRADNLPSPHRSRRSSHKHCPYARVRARLSLAWSHALACVRVRNRAWRCVFDSCLVCELHEHAELVRATVRRHVQLAGLLEDFVVNLKVGDRRLEHTVPVAQ